MRDRILSELGPVPHRRFLVYLMGPYKAFELADLVDPTTEQDLTTEQAHPATDADGYADADDHAFDLEGLPPSVAAWDEATTDYSAADVLAMLERVRDQLRTEAGLNAFLAIDVDVDLAEMDAASQSIAFARASNVVALVAPQVGKNLGVGIETGAVLEALDGTEQERVVFVHEEGVRSAMIAALSRRWEATVYSYADEDELVKRLRQFAVDVMHREQAGDLPPPGSTE